MKSPCISIDRARKRFATFDGFDLVGEFRPYASEEVALATARAEVSLLTDKEPEVVYPVVTHVRMSQRRVSK